MLYHGHCHCGRVRFSFESEPIVQGARCDCSLCVRRGAVLSPKYIPSRDFFPHPEQDDVGVYLWNEHVLNNYFCRVCGVFTYIGDGRDNQDGYRVNLGCVDELDVMALEVRRIDGKSLPLTETRRE